MATEEEFRKAGYVYFGYASPPPTAESLLMEKPKKPVISTKSQVFVFLSVFSKFQQSFLWLKIYLWVCCSAKNVVYTYVVKIRKNQ